MKVALRCKLSSCKISSRSGYRLCREKVTNRQNELLSHLLYYLGSRDNWFHIVISKHQVGTSVSHRIDFLSITLCEIDFGTILYLIVLYPLLHEILWTISVLLKFGLQFLWIIWWIVNLQMNCKTMKIWSLNYLHILNSIITSSIYCRHSPRAHLAYGASVRQPHCIWKIWG